MTDKADRKIAAARRLVAHLAQTLDADLSVRLWNGERLPLGSRVSDDLGFAINTPQALTRLVRRPRFATLVELLADGGIEIEGGTLLDIAHRRGQMRTKGLFRRLDKLLLARNLAPFAFGSTKANESQAFAGPIETSVEKGRDDKALIGFHYDLSNAFYALFLDERMVYTCAYFEPITNDIDEAQRAKLDMICRKLRLKPGDRFLDIGCGWGALVIHAAQHYGAKSHGVTLSEEQFAFAQARIAALGLQDRVTVELRDYRSLEEPESFDKIASIGMFEAVGIDNHDIYFRQMHKTAAAARALPASLDRAPVEEGHEALPQAARGVQGADDVHLPGRRTRHGRHVDQRAWSATASRCTTSRAGASITSARADCGRSASTPIARLRRPKSAGRRRGCGCSISPVARWRSSAARWAFSRRCRRSATRVRQACR